MSNLISPLVKQQLPDFVRSEYPTFVKFLEKYYEWMEQTGNVIEQTNQLRNSFDVDLASDYYIELIKKDFLPYFPESVTLDKTKFIKLINQFYKAKGTQNSLKFLFRALFNEEIQIYYPKEDILKTSDGKWVLPLALRVETTDSNIFNIERCRIVGQTSKAVAYVEKVQRSIDRELGVTYIEIYISNVEKSFKTGETILATYNDGITNIEVSAVIVGSLSEIKIDPNNRGLFYNAYDATTGYPGDPVSIVGGLNTSSNSAFRAVAYVGETTTGGIPEIIVSNGGFGFRDPALFSNTSIIDFTGGFTVGNFGTETRAQISLLDTETTRNIRLSNTVLNTIITTPIANVENNAISSITTFQNFDVYPIAYILVTGQGGGYASRPDVDVYSYYMENNSDELVLPSTTLTAGSNSISNTSINFNSYFEIGDQVRAFILNKFERVLEVANVANTTLTFTSNFSNTLSGVSIYKMKRANIRRVGSIGRVGIVNSGTGYANGELLIFTGGSGYGANGYIQVDGSGSIISVIVNAHSSNAYAVGGEGYTVGNLPSVTIDTASGIGGELKVLEILGDGETLNLSTTKVGAISKLRVVNYGYDYTDAPVVSLRNVDLVLTNVTPGQVFVSNTKVYQGTSNTNSSFVATVDSYNASTKQLRLFDYKGTINTLLQVSSDDNVVTANVSSVKYYGDGLAKATASFTRGIIKLPGLYLNTDGQLSVDKKIQDGNKYHNFSYIVNTEQDYVKFKKPLYDLIHPSGTKAFIETDNINDEQLYVDLQAETFTKYKCLNAFDVSNTSNVMVCASPIVDVNTEISVGDTVLLYDLTKTLSGTVETTNGSNVVVGTGTNFINDLQIGDVVFITPSTFDTVIDIVDENSFVTQNTITSTNTGETVTLYFNDIKTVVSVNTTAVIVDTEFTTNSSSLTTFVEKS